MAVMLLLLIFGFVHTEAQCELVRFDPIQAEWVAVPIDDLEAEPLPVDYPPYRLLWGQSGIAYVDDEQNLIIQHDDTEVIILEDVDLWGQAWSPDGRFFAFANTTEEAHELAVYDIENDTLTPLLEPLLIWSAYIGLRWSPDGTQLAALLSDPPVGETAFMIDTLCLLDEDAQCTATRLYDPAEDQATGSSLPFWLDEDPIYACSGKLCTLTEDGLEVTEVDEAIINWLWVDVVSPCGEYGLISPPQGYKLVNAEGEIVAEFAWEEMPFFRVKP